MNFLKYIYLILFLVVSTISYSGVVTQSDLEFIGNQLDGTPEVYAVYDLRERKSFLQISRSGSSQFEVLCIHVQIFQQDQGCSELNFEDTLTQNDTVVYDLDNLVRNDGTPAPINLDEDSYGYVAVSSYNCNNRDSNGESSLFGNIRIIDDSGYEYRTNAFSGGSTGKEILSGGLVTNDPPPPSRGGFFIPFNTVNGTTHSDIFAFVVDADRRINGIESGSDDADVVYNEEAGVTFDVFQVDENEEVLSCDRKTIGCGPNIVFNYGINEDLPASRGENLLCEGAGLVQGQTNGYISLENPSFISTVTDTRSDDFEFGCVYGLNNGNGTGSLDVCRVSCKIGVESGGSCIDPN